MKIHLFLTLIHMKKLVLFTAVLFAVTVTIAQDPAPSKKKKDWSKVNLGSRANDHFMIQYGIAGWAQLPDSINKGGFSRSFGLYLMLDKPFKTDPRFSVAFGPGFSTDHIFFKATNITTTNHLKPLQFQNLKDTNHFDKYKLVSAFLELPVELRFCMNPENSNKSFKMAVGIKVGTLVDIHTKGKKWVDKNGTVINGFDDKFVQKQKDKYFFNGNRLAGTIRVGYGNLSLYGTYQLGSLIKEALGPSVKPYSFGITLSGL